MSGSGVRQRLSSKRILLLDSAMGTELERRGARCELPLWSARALLDRPDLVRTIHEGEIAAGADALTANTFRTHARTLGREGLQSRAGELTALAVRLAREASSGAARPVWVLGSLSPLEDCYRPDLVPDEAVLEREHAAQAGSLAAAGVDAILLETHNTVREIAAAARAAAGTGLPFLASMITDGAGRLLSGEPIGDAVKALLPMGPDSIGINCVPARLLAADLAVLGRAAPGVPLVAYGNLGPPEGTGGTRFLHEIAPKEYAALAKGWIGLGARVVGGCCGTTAAHTAALREMRDGITS